MDAVGGEFNAFTEKEHTCFYATVLDRDLPWRIDIVTDVVLNATVTAQDVDIERSVVLEEIAMRDDDPSDLVHDEFADRSVRRHAARPSDPRHRRVDRGADPRARSPATTAVATQPMRMVVAVAGNVDHADGRRAGAPRLRRAPRRASAGMRLAPRAAARPSHAGAAGRAWSRDDTEQANLVLGMPGCPATTRAGSRSACCRRRSAAG